MNRRRTEAIIRILLALATVSVFAEHITWEMLKPPRVNGIGPELAGIYMGILMVLGSVVYYLCTAYFQLRDRHVKLHGLLVVTIIYTLIVTTQLIKQHPTNMDAISIWVIAIDVYTVLSIFLTGADFFRLLRRSKTNPRV